MTHLFTRGAGGKQDRTELDRLLVGLEARSCGNGWSARCPVHDDHTPSLSINYVDDRILFHCHAGCPQEAVLDGLLRRGLWHRLDRLHHVHLRAADPVRLSHRHRIPRPDQRDYGFQLWDQGARLFEEPWPSVLERYFASRGLLPFDPCQRLRLHPGAPTSSGGLVLPALIALVTDVDDHPVAVQATFLKPDGSGKAEIEPNRKTYGSPVGGTVRLLEGDDVLIVGEGIESTLSAMKAQGEGGFALLGTSGLINIRLPEVYRDRRVIISADNDANGKGQSAALTAAHQLKAAGFLDVSIAIPPQSGQDFNDMLQVRS